MPQTLGDGAILLDAFPFDSSPELVTDINGYLRGDRSVDAWTMRSAFKQFFSNGVFGTPGDSFALSKAPSGLAVLVQPGCCVIEGALGGVEERVGPISLTLTPGPVAGNVIYGVFLRYDDNADVRGIELVARPGTAGASPTVPEPDTTSANVYELRLGYVMLPNGATDMSGATIVGEKGTSVCPYANPFNEVDLSEVIDYARSTVDASIDRFTEFLQQNFDFVNSAIDGTTAGNLQAQINELENNVITSENVDGTSIVFSPTADSGGTNVLHIGTGCVGEEQLKFGIDKAGGLASTNALWDVASDLFEVVYKLHLASIDQLDLDTVVTWTFNEDSTLVSGQWSSSGNYYYADGGAA